MKWRYTLPRQYGDGPRKPTTRNLPLILSPLEKNVETTRQRGHQLADEDILAPRNNSASGNLRNSGSGRLGSTRPTAKRELPPICDDNEPRLRVHHEASSIELFYDLFLVANLATFTANHPIDNKPSLDSYMFFFTLLWFTWFQTSIFDVRFGTDSIFSRVAKSGHFGVMIGFAIVGPVFSGDPVERYSGVFRSLSLIMMASRFILIVQYATVAWFVRGFKRTLLPLTLLMVTLFVTAATLLSLAFAFGPHKERHVQDGWYAAVVAEAVIVLAISSQWHVLSFTKTNLVERVGLLTLIILGEGIIGMAKSVTEMMKGTTSVTGSSIGLVICAVLIIYFLYMLYFDQIDHDRFGTVRQPIWALLHFPLHIGILFTVEGSSQFVVWRLAVELSYWVITEVEHHAKNITTMKELIDSLNTTFSIASHHFTAVAPLNYSGFYQTLQGLDKGNITQEHRTRRIREIVGAMSTDTYVWVFGNLGIDAPETHGTEVGSGEVKMVAITDVYTTVFLYFFIAAGCTLILLSVMYCFGNKHKSRGELSGIAVRFTVGIGLVALSMMDLSRDRHTLLHYIISPWILPTVTISYAIVIALDNIFLWFFS